MKLCKVKKEKTLIQSKHFFLITIFVTKLNHYCINKINIPPRIFYWSSQSLNLCSWVGISLKLSSNFNLKNSIGFIPKSDLLNTNF